jgi:type I restriction enzyme M protein
MPSGTFQGAGVKTVVLFYDKGQPTNKIWYYQLDPGRNMGKTNPLNDRDLEDFLNLQKTKADSDKSWTIDVADVDQATYDLSVKNPTKKEEKAIRTPTDILAEMRSLDEETISILNSIAGLV